MKELTLEEKAKRYDEALEKARDILDSTDDNYVCTYLTKEDIKRMYSRFFPELREVDDEEIRKTLISYFNTLGGDYFGELKLVDILAWFKKQNPNADNANKEYWRGYREGKQEVLDKYAELEKQGEKKLTDKVKPKFKIGDRICLKPEYRMPNDDTPIADTIHEIIAISDKHYRFEDSFIFIEDQDKFELVEQNPVGNPEPKFQNGQWITNGDYTWKIVEVKPLDYILQSQDGNIVDDTISHVDEQFHSFTIKDAKDGDVLFMENASANCIFIYKSFNNGIINKYASYNNFGFEGEHYLVLNDGYVIPTTKEQRNTFIAKMKEADYKWNAEKKELKKIEQKPAEWSENDENAVSVLKHIIKQSEKINSNIYTKPVKEKLFEWLEALKNKYGRKPSEEL